MSYTMGLTYHLAEIIKPTIDIDEGDYRLMLIPSVEDIYLFIKRENDEPVHLTSKQLKYVNIQPIPDWI